MLADLAEKHDIIERTFGEQRRAILGYMTYGILVQNDAEQP